MITLNEKQEAMVTKFVAKVAETFTERTGRDMPETGLHNWTREVSKLCRAVLRAQSDSRAV